MQILAIDKTPTATITSTSLKTLQNGGLIIFPTETVYGALVDATNPVAVAKLLQFKKRRAGKPLSIACYNQEMASKYVHINEQAKSIYQSLLPGPITVISNSLNRVASGIASEFNTIGVRIPNYPLLLELIQKIGLPLTATSANLSGQKNPYSISDVLSHLSLKQKKQIDLIIDAGQLPPNPPSIVIDTTQTTPIYMRDQKETSTELKEEIFTSTSPQETQEIAAKIVFRHFDQLITDGLVLALDGELGAGKTTFTQGIGQFLNLNQNLSSPTYTYIKEYNFAKNGLNGHLFHLDVWRINSATEVDLLNIESLFAPGNLIIIEWWEQIASLIKISIPFLQIKISELKNQERQISLLNHAEK